jgi:hypothetical protein
MAGLFRSAFNPPIMPASLQRLLVRLDLKSPQYIILVRTMHGTMTVIKMLRRCSRFGKMILLIDLSVRLVFLTLWH